MMEALGNEAAKAGSVRLSTGRSPVEGGGATEQVREFGHR
jgi:hypothetical protein